MCLCDPGIHNGFFMLNQNYSLDEVCSLGIMCMFVCGGFRRLIMDELSGIYECLYGCVCEDINHFDEKLEFIYLFVRISITYTFGNGNKSGFVE
jgi:hypothetical protein